MWILRLACVLVGIALASAYTFEPRRDNFIDYLIREVDGRRSAPRVSSNAASVQEQSSRARTTGGRQAFTSANVLPYGMYIFDLLFYFRSVPKRHWSCCMLGVLAGDKGFHCHVDFYANDIVQRNFNRVHSRAMDWYRPNSGQRRRSALNTMRAFSKCVNVHSDEFRKCCEASTLQKIAYERWRQHMRSSTNSWNDYRNTWN